ncbi:hypothetical protein, partial [Aminobacter ciceronei]|uniref:hypothetical protein n=1 Tax=Aminobacter ciceronei TaxID=150723 RepID=UPI001AEE0892
LSFHGINTSGQKPKVLPMCPVRNVTYVSGRSATFPFRSQNLQLFQSLAAPLRAVKPDFHGFPPEFLDLQPRF